MGREEIKAFSVDRLKHGMASHSLISSAQLIKPFP